MDKWPVQIGVGTLDLTDAEKASVMEAMNTNRLSYGPFSRKFEREFAEAHDCKYGVLVNSGTSALSIAIATLKETRGWEDGDEILVPALTFIATSNVVLDHNLVPVFVDCDRKTYNIDPAKIREKLTPRTRGIMPVHLFGLVADMDPIMAIAAEKNLGVIEDSCETMGVKYKGRKTGSFGDVGCFSTYVAHLIVTGVGGLAISKDEKTAEILRSVANHGRDSIYMSIDDDKDIDGSAFQQVIRRRFRFVRRGFSFRATEMEAALGLGQLSRLDKIIGARQKNAAGLLERLKPYEKWLQLPSFDSSVQEHAFMMFPIVVREDAGFGKWDLVDFLETWNVETRDMLPLINQPVYKYMNIRQEDYPVADWVNRCGFYVGSHQGIDEKQLDYMAAVFKAFFDSKHLS